MPVYHRLWDFRGLYHRAELRKAILRVRVCMCVHAAFVEIFSMQVPSPPRQNRLSNKRQRREPMRERTIVCVCVCVCVCVRELCHCVIFGGCINGLLIKTRMLHAGKSKYASFDDLVRRDALTNLLLSFLARVRVCLCDPE